MKQHEFKIGDLVMIDSQNEKNSHLKVLFGEKYTVIDVGDYKIKVTNIKDGKHQEWFIWRVKLDKSYILKEILRKTEIDKICK